MPIREILIIQVVLITVPATLAMSTSMVQSDRSFKNSWIQRGDQGNKMSYLPLIILPLLALILTFTLQGFILGNYILVLNLIATFFKFGAYLQSGRPNNTIQPYPFVLPPVSPIPPVASPQVIPVLSQPVAPQRTPQVSPMVLPQVSNMLTTPVSQPAAVSSQMGSRVPPMANQQDPQQLPQLMVSQPLYYQMRQTQVAPIRQAVPLNHYK